AVGPTAEIMARHRASRVIDGARKAIMPGLIDCHAHAGHGLVKTMGGGRGDLWNEACGTIYTVGSTPDFWYAEARLAALERLKCGTTCGVSYLGGGDDVMRTDEPVYGERHCDGVAEVGVRSYVAVGPNRPPYPKRYASWQGMTRRDHEVTFQNQLDTCATLIDRCHGSANGRVRICLTFPVHHRELGPEQERQIDVIKLQARAVRDLGRRRKVLFTQDGHRNGSIAEAGTVFDLLGPDAFFAHSIELTERDIAMARDSDTRIVHNPSAIMSIRGRCPVPELIDAGVTVALGSDGTAPDRGADMFRHMFQCMHYHRRHFRDARILPQGKVLEMATIDAARTLGAAHELGSLEPGKKADIILIDMFKPHLYPLNMPVYRVVCFANGADVDTVIVDGQVLMEGRRVLTVDEADILDQAQREAALMIERIGGADLLAQPEWFWGASRQ
ncbi:MAG: amidohydrolase family protein, partial [Alphaproteobacteria bacterium]|nr:amidohydrolase family protein [Alphaproteobacteria bacterium]